LLPGMRPVTSYREFYLDYESDLARVAFVEGRDSAKAIATPGAWGLLRSMTAVFERALSESWDSVLVLEDDVLWHKDTLILFDRFMAQAPSNWLVMQLGARQLHWDNAWTSWHSENLYMCHGSSIAAHAFGVRRAVFPLMLERCRARDLPFDIGALHTVKSRFAERCFTMFPNLVIQDAIDSDIGMSSRFFRDARRLDNIYRWHLPDYGLAAIRVQQAAEHARMSVNALGAAAHDNTTFKHHPKWTQRFSDYARLRPWRRQPIAAGTALARAPAGPKGATSKRKLGGQPPLKARGKQPKTHAIIAVVIGLERDPLIRVLDLLRAERTRSDFEPILLTDCSAFELFRDRRLVFEYLQAPALRQRLAPGLDWELYLLRRLALLRRKWQPVRIVGFGTSAAQLVAMWKDSPVEDESIHRVVAAAKTIELT
jgi:GR25 family glycosyltransferase involved in LPS biosynthesis